MLLDKFRCITTDTLSILNIEKDMIECFKENFPNGIDLKNEFKVSIEEQSNYKGISWKTLNQSPNLYFSVNDDHWSYITYNDIGDVLYELDSYNMWDKYEYDKRGNLIKTENSYGHINKWEYDDNDLLIYKEDRHGKWEHIIRSKDGKILTRKNSNGFVESFKYENGKMVERTTSDGIHEILTDSDIPNFWGNLKFEMVGEQNGKV